MYAPQYFNPLTDYHNVLRAGSAAGYPNMPWANPHPYEISYVAGLRPPRRFQFTYGRGRSGQQVTGGLRGSGLVSSFGKNRFARSSRF